MGFNSGFKGLRLEMPRATPAPLPPVCFHRGFLLIKCRRAPTALPLWFLKSKHDDSNIACSGVLQFEGRTSGSVVGRHMGVMRSSKSKRTVTTFLILHVEQIPVCTTCHTANYLSILPTKYICGNCLVLRINGVPPTRRKYSLSL